MLPVGELQRARGGLVFGVEFWYRTARPNLGHADSGLCSRWKKHGKTSGVVPTIFPVTHGHLGIQLGALSTFVAVT